MNKILQLGALAFSTVCLTLTVHAANSGKSVLTQPRAVENTSEWRPHVGILVGAQQPEGSGPTASEFGLDVGYQPYIPYGLAAEYNHARIDDGFQTKNRDTLWLKGTYNFGGTAAVIKDSYAGVGVGAVFKSDGTALAIAPVIGFDIPMDIGDRNFISLGASSKYAIVSDNEVDTLSLAGVLKYWY